MCDKKNSKSSDPKSPKEWENKEYPNLIKMIREEVHTYQKLQSKRLFEWATLCVAVLGFLLGAYNFYLSRDLTKTTNEQNIDNLIRQTFDILGGGEKLQYIESNLRVRDISTFVEAKQKIDEILRLDPKNARAHMALALWYASKGIHDREKEYIEKAIHLDSKYVAPHVYLGTLYADQGNHKEALESYKKAIQIKDDIAEVYFNLGNSYYHMKSFDDAYNAYTKANKLDPNIPSIYLGLGNVLLKQGKIARAIEKYNMAIEQFNKTEELDSDNYSITKQQLKKAQKALRSSSGR